MYGVAGSDLSATDARLLLLLGQMLFIRSRKVLTALFFAWHATLSLCGPGHHGLSGFVERFVSEERSTPSVHSDSDCPVCHFLSHSSDFPSIGPAVVHPPAVGDCRTIDLISADDPISRRANPRAPPHFGR